MVADNLPQEKVAGIKQMFHMMDTDKNGNLTFEELKHGLHRMGQPVADPDVQMLMDAVSKLFNLYSLVSIYYYQLKSACFNCNLFP